MRHHATLRMLVGVVAATTWLFVAVGGASAQGQFHGIAFTKGCAGPTNVGQPYNCAYQILNVVDQGQDTVQVTGLTDVVHSAGGDVNSGNILSALELVFSAPTVSCVGGSGAGTAASPYVGATMCTLPFGTNIQTNNHSFYTVQAGDFGLPGNTLTDTATLNWNNTCTAPGVLNCTTAAQTASAGSSTVVQALPSQTSTVIQNAANNTITVAEAPATVHDVATITGVPGAPAPTGTVNFEFFTNGTCTAPASAPIAGETNVPVPATSAPRGPLSAGLYSYMAHYSGDQTYLPSDGPCEPLQVVDASIQIAPPTATNPVNTNHTLTVTVTVNDGTGPAPAPNGTVVNLSLTNAGGADAGFGSAGGPTTTTCTTAGGICTVTITSSTAGTTTVHASTDVVVSGLTLHRETNGVAPNSGDATKTWTGGGQGCTPGYWKNHPEAWGPPGFSPNDTLGSVFTDTGRPSTTLIAALRLKGGSTIQAAKDILLRAAVASLLNAAHPGVNFTLSVADVTSMVNAALASNNRATILALASQLDAANNAGCPLN